MVSGTGNPPVSSESGDAPAPTTAVEAVVDPSAGAVDARAGRPTAARRHASR